MSKDEKNKKFLTFDIIQKHPGDYSNCLYLKGCASVYGIVDHHKHVIKKGALSIEENVGMKYEHIDFVPNGIWSSVKSDEYGLYVEGYIKGVTDFDNHLINQIRRGKISELSVGFICNKRDSTHYKEVNGIGWVLWGMVIEISLVHRGANEKTFFYIDENLDVGKVQKTKKNKLNNLQI